MGISSDKPTCIFIFLRGNVEREVSRNCCKAHIHPNLTSEVRLWKCIGSKQELRHFSRGLLSENASAVPH